MHNIKIANLMVVIFLLSACGGGSSPEQQYRQAFSAANTKMVEAMGQYSETVAHYADCTSTMLKCVQPALDKMTIAADYFDAIEVPTRYRDAHKHLKLYVTHIRNFVHYTQAGLENSDAATLQKGNDEIPLGTKGITGIHICDEGFAVIIIK